ncbi:MAG: hypothetical protein ACREDU_11920, partial [Methylocella sp.]
MRFLLAAIFAGRAYVDQLWVFRLAPISGAVGAWPGPAAGRWPLGVGFDAKLLEFRNALVAPGANAKTGVPALFAGFYPRPFADNRFSRRWIMVCHREESLDRRGGWVNRLVLDNVLA